MTQYAGCRPIRELFFFSFTLFITVRCRIVTLHFTVFFFFFFALSFVALPYGTVPSFLPSPTAGESVSTVVPLLSRSCRFLSFFPFLSLPPSSARIDLREWRHVYTRTSWVLDFAFATPIPVYYIISYYHSIASYDTDADAETKTDTGDASSACVGYVWLCFAVQYSAMLCSTVR